MPQIDFLVSSHLTLNDFNKYLYVEAFKKKKKKTI